MADETLRVATGARAQVGFANHLAAVEREFGVDVSVELARSVSQAELALGEVVEGVGGLGETSSVVSVGLVSAGERFVVVSGEVLGLIASGESVAANVVASSELDAAYSEFFGLVAEVRDVELGAVVSSDALTARLGFVARFLVALLIPLAVILIYREVVRRQQRQAELEMRIDAEREIGKSRDDFVANASHEFRTPLTSIYGLAQLIEEDMEASEAVREMAGMISSESSDLSRMVEDLLTTARLEAGALSFQSEQVLTHDEVGELVAPFRHRGIDVALDVSPAAVRVDRLRQRQVLRNLLSNAEKYGGDQILVTGKRDGAWFEWRVSDNGDGVPAALQGRLFERFMHQGTAVSAPGGVGLGLSIVRALAEGMGGSVTYEHTNGWTHFIMRVPIAAAEVTALRPAAPPPEAPGGFQIAASSPYDGTDRRSE